MTLGEELLQDQIDRLEEDKRDLTNMLVLAHQAMRDAAGVICRLADGHLDLDADEDEPERIAADAVVAINAALEKVGAGKTAPEGHNA